MKTLQPVLLLLFLCAQTSCSYYQRYAMSKTRLERINPEGLSVYLVDAAHPLTRSWYIADVKFEGDRVTGYLSRMAEVETLEMSMLRNRLDAQQSKNDILLYAKPQFALTLPDTATMTISNSQLEKVEVCEMNHVKTIGRPLMGCTGIFLLAYLISGE